MSGSTTCGLRIAEPHVELDDLGSIRRQHETHIQKPAIRLADLRVPLDDRLDDTLVGVAHEIERRERTRRERAHAAGVRPAVVVTDAFVILRAAEIRRVLAIGEKKERHLGSRQAFLDHQPRAGRAELFVDHRGAHGGFRLGTIGRDCHALPGRQTIGLHDHWKTELGARNGVERRRRIVTDDEARGGNAVVRHEGFGMRLRTFEQRAAPRRTDESDGRSRERDRRARVRAAPRARPLSD
jgi:hypothetical protein